MYVLSEEASTKRKQFFQYVYGENKGYVCLATRDPNTREYKQHFFRWPYDAAAMEEFIKRFFNQDLYFCPALLDARSTRKENVVFTPCAWSDLDTCDPDNLLIPVSFEIESSPGRFQGLWMFSELVSPTDAEDISRRIAYRHKEEGADISGWDLSQVLRIPYTHNFKYGGLGDAPTVKITRAKTFKYKVSDFDIYPQVRGHEYSKIPFPTELPGSADDVLHSHRRDLHPHVWYLFQHPPKDDWSKPLWQLEMLLLESGLTREETFAVCREAACNKYKRDDRSEVFLWKEICRAEFQVKERSSVALLRNTTLDPLLSDEERESVSGRDTFIEEYMAWAKTTGDAAWQYHQVGAFVVLSSLLAGSIRLPTSFGTVVPNLWFMILADTTLTRKTTAMDLAMDLISELDSDIILATDGSIEGLFTSLSMRPGRPSVFLRDEFSGLLDAMIKKDYYAGMAETLTKMYDGKMQKRVLRREVIEVKKPCLIIFAGGIRSRVQELLTYEFVVSGFLPRFIVVAAESNIDMLKPLGPPSPNNVESRSRLLATISAIVERYSNAKVTVQVNGQTVAEAPGMDLSLTPEAWARYNKFEAEMLAAALDSEQPDLLMPSFDRLSKSGLKAAMLIAAARCVHEENVVIQEEDVVSAIHYVEGWRQHTLTLLKNIGLTTSEKTLQVIMDRIQREPGLYRSALMTKYHLTKQSADAIFGTLDERGLIMIEKAGKSSRIYPVKGDMG